VKKGNEKESNLSQPHYLKASMYHATTWKIILNTKGLSLDMFKLIDFLVSGSCTIQDAHKEDWNEQNPK
jgi:hypothetical protein